MSWGIPGIFSLTHGARRTEREWRWRLHACGWLAYSGPSFWAQRSSVKAQIRYPGITGICDDPSVDNLSSSQIAEAVPGLSFCGLVDQGRVLISLLHVPFPFKILYQIQIKRAAIPRLLLHLQDGSKAWEREWGWGRGRAWLSGKCWDDSKGLCGQSRGAWPSAGAVEAASYWWLFRVLESLPALKYLSVPSCQVLKFPQESAAT